MNQADAFAEAQRLWGDSGKVWHNILAENPCHVGILTDYGHMPYGKGLTWEEAFEDAKKNGH